jgi:hypothetical protein
MKQLAALCLFLLVTVSAAAQTVTGSITINGKKTTLDHVTAIRKGGNVKVILSDHAITPAQLGDDFAMHDMKDLSGVDVEITPDGQIPSGTFYSPLLTRVGGSFSAAGMHKWEGTIKGDTIEGKLSTGKGEFFDNSYEYTATFKAPIASGKAAAAPAPVLKGKPLPADGGEPGKAYRAYIVILKAGSPAKIKASISAERAKQMSDDELKKMLPVIQAMMPDDIKIGSGAVDGDHATLNVTGKEKEGGAKSHRHRRPRARRGSVEDREGELEHEVRVI